MVRFMMKGGVWKNTEDEILKAAVMKYGLNQWARISSLIVRKSAKQCKARWYEWLDPKIKKTEWSREEEEKLLHLAKLMPTQWRTIAPIVGRTAAQCLEHYEKLLDAAQFAEEGEEGDGVGGYAESRKLRPGEIDPHPETKPAKPDPVDMDEDEKEMLSEARARLANTQGKKAKRKAREKQLDEARRLATLQKKRELKAAGLPVPRRRKKLKHMDYNKEIPFERRAKPGFFDTGKEKDRDLKRGKISFRAINLQRMEGMWRDDEEEKQRRKEREVAERKKIMNMPEAVNKINELHDLGKIKVRGKMALPTPQIGDGELEELAKMGYSSDTLTAQGSGAFATPLGTRTPTSTPMVGRTPIGGRTPLGGRTPTVEHSILAQAQNLIAFQSGDTPLKGGENTPLRAPSDFGGATPTRSEHHTPNPYASTPTQSKTSRADARLAEMQKRAQKQQIKMSLAALPEPKHTYELQLPTMDVDEEVSKPAMAEDAADIAMRGERLVQAREAEKLRKRSEVLKSKLPRPLAINKKLFQTSDADPAALISQEILSMLTYEALEYPVRGQKKPNRKGVKPYDDLEEAHLAEAKYLLSEEMDDIAKELSHDPVGALEQYAEAWDTAFERIRLIPSKKSFGDVSAASKRDKCASLKNQFDAVMTGSSKTTQKSKRLQQRVELYTGGYVSRAATLKSDIDRLYAELESAALELSSFEQLHILEQQAIPTRTAQIEQLLQQAKERERTLQQRHLELSRQAV